jgi:hypothetical protein
MRYGLKRLEPTLTGDLNLDDEIALVRVTIEDLVQMLNQQVELHQRVAIGSLIREAVADLSGIIDKAARLPKQTAMSFDQVGSMLRAIEDAVTTYMPDGVARQQLITVVKGKLEGISVTEPHHALILRTCDMMNRSVPYVDEEP